MRLSDGYGDSSALPDRWDLATGAAFDPHAARLHDWVDRLLWRGGDDAIPKLLAAAGELRPGYLVRFDSPHPADVGARGRSITRRADPPPTVS